MKLTLLDMTQTILSSLNSDEVNSISDTTESMQVAEIIRQTYFNLISRVNFPEHDQLVQLDASTDDVAPVLMYVPAGIGKLSWIKYFNTNIINDSVGGGHDINVDIIPTGNDPQPPVPGYQYVTILPVKQFLDMTDTFNPEMSDVESFVFTNDNNGKGGTYTFYYKNNKQPQYCTIISDYYVIFDGYDNTQDSTLQSSKTEAWGEVIPVFTMEDNFIPNLDDTTFPLLLNEAKSLAFFELKQMMHTKAEQEAKRGWSSVQKDKSVINRPTYFDALPNFGRRGFRGTSFFKSMGWDRQ